jgi:hypothetical protein
VARTRIDDAHDGVRYFVETDQRVYELRDRYIGAGR